MRTSRNSRETARLFEAASSPPTRSTRRSLRSFVHDANETPKVSPADTFTPNGLKSEEPSSLGKRKRDGTIRSPASINIESTTIRQSPRKSMPGIGAPDEGKSGKPRRQPAKHVKGPNGSVKVEAPLDWERLYHVCAEMRKRVLAPVDTMGCESLAEDHRSPAEQRLQTLVSLMLSSQTKDTVTAAAMRNLQEKLPGGLTLDSLLTVEPAELNRLIEKVGFHNNKTKYIKAAAIILRDQHHGDIPDTAVDLIALPGVGPKMAYLCLSAAWGKHEGIGVDVHVHRITNLWGWHKTSTPEQTRAELEAWLPVEKWHDINHLLVGLGQTICLPLGRKCGECDLGKQDLCPSAVAVSPAKRKVKREVEIKIEDVEAEAADARKVEGHNGRVKLEEQAEGPSSANGECHILTAESSNAD